jgi:hypothetical protein
VGQLTVGSNPTPSALKNPESRKRLGIFSFTS